MNQEEFEKAVSLIKSKAVATLYINGKRQYLWSPERGWLKPGPRKEAMKKKTKGKKPKRAPGY